MEVCIQIPNAKQAKTALAALSKMHPNARLLISVVAETNHIPHEQHFTFPILHVRVPLAAAVQFLPTPPAAQPPPDTKA